MHLIAILEISIKLELIGVIILYEVAGSLGLSQWVALSVECSVWEKFYVFCTLCYHRKIFIPVIPMVPQLRFNCKS